MRCWGIGVERGVVLSFTSTRKGQGYRRPLQNPLSQLLRKEKLAWLENVAAAHPNPLPTAEVQWGEGVHRTLLQMLFAMGAH